MTNVLLHGLQFHDLRFHAGPLVAEPRETPMLIKEGSADQDEQTHCDKPSPSQLARRKPTSHALPNTDARRKELEPNSLLRDLARRRRDGEGDGGGWFDRPIKLFGAVGFYPFRS